MLAAVPETVDHKEQAIRCWTAVPCGSRVATDQPGTRPYIESLLAGRHAYAPWMATELGYESAEGLDVLDVGSGQGIDLARFALAGARVTGIDLTPRHVELASAHLEALGLDGRVQRGDAEALPFPDASFDRITSNGVLHHTPDFDAALAEIFRVLRPGGELRLILYHRDSLYYWLTQVLGHGVAQGRLFRERSMSRVMAYNEGGSSADARPLVRVYSRNQLRRSLEGHGYVSVQIHVRHFSFADLPFTKPLARVERWQNARVLDWIGRRVGWYLVACAIRPRVP